MDVRRPCGVVINDILIWKEEEEPCDDSQTKKKRELPLCFALLSWNERSNEGGQIVFDRSRCLFFFTR